MLSNWFKFCTSPSISSDSPVYKTEVSGFFFHLGGRKFKVNIEGGILPTIRINPQKPDKVFQVGAYTSIGAEYRISNKIEVFADIFGVYFVPFINTLYDHFGGSQTERRIGKLTYLNIGAKYFVWSK